MISEETFQRLDLSTWGDETLCANKAEILVIIGLNFVDIGDTTVDWNQELPFYDCKVEKDTFLLGGCFVIDDNHINHASYSLFSAWKIKSWSLEASFCIIEVYLVFTQTGFSYCKNEGSARTCLQLYFLPAERYVS